MPSLLETVEKAKLVRKLIKQGHSPDSISARIDRCSRELIEEYTKANSHKKSCPVCGGLGVSKNRETGIERPLCTLK